MKIFKNTLCVFLVVILALISVAPAFAVEIADLTFLYIDKGNIVIGDGTVSGYGYQGQKVTAFNENGYCITMAGSEETSNSVTVSGGDNYIVLRAVNIVSDNSFQCAFSVENGAKADIFFTGENTLKSGSSRAGLEISDDSQVTLGGDGILYARSGNQAGIGGSGGNNGTVIINSGTIVAQCTNGESTGIGGGSSGEGGNIIINGGNVIAKGGSYAAGIGGGCARAGGNITINGGTVTAIGGVYGAGIGGGWYGGMGNVIINGGSVLAKGGEDAPSIGDGSGLGYSTGAVNSDGKKVYPVKVAPGNAPWLDVIYVNNESFNICGDHYEDSNYYVYLPSGTYFIAAESEGSQTAIYKITISASGTVTKSAVEPVSAVNGAEIGSDNIIRGIRCGLTSLNGYIEVADGYTVSYDNEYMGTGTKATVMFGDTPVYTYRVLLYGDINNDGFYDGEDSFLVLIILWDMLTPKNSDPIIFEAADADRNGVITEEDMYLLEKAGIMRADVEQGATEIISDSFGEYILLVDQTPHFAADSDETAVDVPEEIKIEKKDGIWNFLVDFIKNAIKLFSTVYSFWKNYFI